VHTAGKRSQLRRTDQQLHETPNIGCGIHLIDEGRGEIEIAIQQISEILPVQGAELVGPLPGDLQLTTVFATGIGTGAKEPAAAKEFTNF
jgi:hypothetical protein